MEEEFPTLEGKSKTWRQKTWKRNIDCNNLFSSNK